MGDIYTVGCIRKRQSQTTDRPVKLRIRKYSLLYENIFFLIHGSFYHENKITYTAI
jgi:hypothetical protein